MLVAISILHAVVMTSRLLICITFQPMIKRKIRLIANPDFPSHRSFSIFASAELEQALCPDRDIGGVSVACNSRDRHKQCESSLVRPEWLAAHVVKGEVGTHAPAIWGPDGALLTLVGLRSEVVVRDPSLEL